MRSKAFPKSIETLLKARLKRLVCRGVKANQSTNASIAKGDRVEGVRVPRAGVINFRIVFADFVAHQLSALSVDQVSRIAPVFYNARNEHDRMLSSDSAKIIEKLRKGLPRL